jgi:putative membrane protein insertion efficiency factor
VSAPLAESKRESAAKPDDQGVVTTTTRRGSRRRLLVVALAIGLVLAFDLTRAPAHQLSARALIGSIHLYQATLSPRLGAAGVRCRFKPTCSHYAEGAIRKGGALVGTARAAWRILRCGPWTPAGTYDPP